MGGWGRREKREERREKSGWVNGLMSRWVNGWMGMGGWVDEGVGRREEEVGKKGGEG